MKIRSSFLRALRLGFCALLLLSAVGCPRKKPIFTLSPSSMLFSGPQDGAPPPDQTLTMTGIDEIPERGATWGLFTDQPWLTVTPTEGLLHANEDLVLTVHADQTLIPQGLYSGQITIIAHYGKHTYPATFDVTLDVTAGNSPPPIVIPAPEETELAAGDDEDDGRTSKIPARLCFAIFRR